jgi:hypothetical protein
MLYVGLDVHSRQSSLCILNSAGGVVNQVQLKGPRAAVVDRLRQLDQPFSVCYEASCGYDLRATPERCPECGATALESVNTQK